MNIINDKYSVPLMNPLVQALQSAMMLGHRGTLKGRRSQKEARSAASPGDSD